MSGEGDKPPEVPPRQRERKRKWDIPAQPTTEAALKAQQVAQAVANAQAAAQAIALRSQNADGAQSTAPASGASSVPAGEDSASLMAAAARAAYAINQKAQMNPIATAKLDPAAMAKAAAAQIGASLAVQNAHAQFTREIEINTWPSRFELIKRAMNGELFQRSGAVVTCKGRYRAPGDQSGDERPLYLHISADTQDKLERCALLVQGKKGPDSGYVGDFNTARVFVQLEVEMVPPQFDLIGRLVGIQNAYLQHIATQSGAAVSLVGRGSGCAHPATRDQPLHLELRSVSDLSLQAARNLAESLVRGVQSAYQQFRMTPPTALHGAGVVPSAYDAAHQGLNQIPTSQAHLPAAPSQDPKKDATCSWPPPPVAASSAVSGRSAAARRNDHGVVATQDSDKTKDLPTVRLEWKPLAWPRRQIMIPPTIDQLWQIEHARRGANKGAGSANQSSKSSVQEYDPFADDDDD